ncbi:MAG: Dabb family protein [Spirochaetales bacterium]|nr:Dabb family protein [Spirochaetales bacterium]
MIKHIVMWKFKDEAEGKSKVENIEIIKKDLEDLVGVIPQIRTLEVGVNKNTESKTAFDAVLVSTFDTMEDVAAYRADPRHKKAAAYNKLCRIDRVVVDYEF